MKSQGDLAGTREFLIHYTHPSAVVDKELNREEGSGGVGPFFSYFIIFTKGVHQRVPTWMYRPL